ncbi:hypothetical protein PPL_10014 [Heterostelium album PN500]|uniref:Uncharacterized protein n=1 Tax=Heterostelium pallidum (strain ATCC 26659 / Pp 5 / PN500) TaxID=670386 RepID=D3BPX0_HETP5|nr:hypothetical protein PPL_10014 [Heterostelium album PN500]EFA76253.1 hypothetical protein PPL_10014 [Heterostelium album PN500]|eukprot:XP_020428386.1 hypothetical protein PPL_10014 [Heterostelium album PN500]
MTLIKNLTNFGGSGSSIQSKIHESISSSTGMNVYQNGSQVTDSNYCYWSYYYNRWICNYYGGNRQY